MTGHGHSPGSSSSITQNVTPSEQTPLLAANEDIAPTADPLVSEATTPSDPHGDLPETYHEDEERPLPKRQIFWLCFARLVEPMAFFSIFPYINQMAQQNGSLAHADVGFYSGLIESLFSLTQAIVMIFWGRAADKAGRKPVLVGSLVGVALATSIFGMATTIWEMILFRCLAGVFAGTIVTIRTMIAEHSTPKTQAVAFSWFAFSGNMGILLGPLLGGALADPARQYPWAFRNVQFFIDYPYALSSFVIGILGLVAVVTSALFVEETLDKPERDTSSESGIATPKKPKLSTVDILKAPGVGKVLFIYAHIMLLAFSYTAVVPVFWFTDVKMGGFGFQPWQISIMMGINGAAQAMWLLLVFPPLQHRWGTNRVLRACSDAYPVFFLVCPLGNVLLRHDAATAFWVMAPPLLAVGSGVSMSFTAIQLALNDVTPSPQVLGTLNALALTGTSVMRAFSPALFTSLFAIGARTQWLWGEAIWTLMVALALGFTVLSRYLPDPQDMQRGRAALAGRQEEQPQEGLIRGEERRDASR